MSSKKNYKVKCGERHLNWTSVRLSYGQKLAMLLEIRGGRLFQVTSLTTKLIKWLGPYLKAHAGEEDVHAMLEFVNMIMREAKDRELWCQSQVTLQLIAVKH